MLTIDNILQLSAAGYSKAEINALATAAAGSATKGATEQPAPKQEQSASIEKQLAAIMSQLAALAPKQEEPVPKQEDRDGIAAQLSTISAQLAGLKAPEQKKEEPDVLSILQAMNVNNQRYDLPPKYDVEKNIADYYADMIGAEKKEEKK